MPWSASRTSCGGCEQNSALAESAPGRRGRRRREPGGALRHHLRHHDHRPGVRAAVRAVGDRGPAVRAARHRLHRLDLRVAGDLDHRHAGPGLLPAGGQRPRPRGRQLRGAASQARQRRPAALGVRATARRCSRRSPPRSVVAGVAALPDAAQLPAAVQRRHAAGHHPVQSRHLARGIAPARLHRRADRRAGAGGAHGRPPHRPRRARRARRRRARQRARRRSRALRRAPRTRSTPTSARGSRCCRCRSISGSRSRTASTTCCPACGRRSRSRSMAKTSTRCGGWRRRCATGSPASPGWSTCRSRSRS